MIKQLITKVEMELLKVLLNNSKVTKKDKEQLEIYIKSLEE